MDGEHRAGRAVRRPDRGANLERMSSAPTVVDEPIVEDVVEPDVPWIVIVWNDPINLMTYVTWVFQKLFGYPRVKAEKLMMDVHTKGKAVVSNGPRERCE